MTTMERPYFLSDPSWYEYDEDEGIYRLTDKAPEEARKSYDEFYETLDKLDYGIEDEERPPRHQTP